VPNTTNITPPRVLLTDPRTGQIAREWYMFLLNLFTLTGSGTSDVTIIDLLNTPAPPDIAGLLAFTQQNAELAGPAWPEIDAAIRAALEQAQQLGPTPQNYSAAIQAAVDQAQLSGPSPAQLGAVAALNMVTTPYGGTGLATWTAGDLPYYTSGDSLSKLAIGTSTKILTSSGTAPQWSDPTAVTVGTATNLAGGAANRIPYQTGAGATSFIAAPTISDTYLNWSGSAFQWSANPLGTVTSVGASFTGGLVSVGGSPVTSSGTLALTVAGTSGGVPYFSSASTWASSAVLATNALVIGGGAGAAPATTTTGTGVIALLAGTSSGTSGLAGTANPTFTGTLTAAAITASGIVSSATEFRLAQTYLRVATVADAVGWTFGGGYNFAFNSGVGWKHDSTGTLSGVAYNNVGSIGFFAAGSAVAGTAAAQVATFASNLLTLSQPLNYGGVTLSNAVTGTGNMVLSASPTLTTPVLGAATGTSLALGGATLGSNALAVTGTTALSGLLTAAGGVSSTLVTDATSATTGSIITAGGISMQKALWVGTTSRHVGATQFDAAITYGGVTLSNAVTGTGNMVLSAGPTFTGTLSSANHTITSASAASLVIGLNGATNPAFTVDSSTALQVAGLKVTGAVTGGTVALVATDSGANTSLTINAKGTGTIGIGSVSTGAVTITPATTHSSTTTLSGALTYGGVTLSNAVTGTGNMVLSASPTLTGTLTAATATFSGVVTHSSTTTLSAALTYGGVALSNSVTGTGSMVLGTPQTTWTPADGSGASLSFANVTAKYEKFGNLVHAYGFLTFPTTASSANAVISGFPVTSANANYAAVACAIYCNGAATALKLIMNVNATTAQIVGAGNAPITNATMTGINLAFMMIYPAA